MNKQPLILEASQANFDRYVIENSLKAPVLVEFMAMWSGPCMAMSHVLETLAGEFAGQFVFAKVDSDEQPELLERYGVKNVPSLLVFQNGEEGFRQEGQMQEEELRVLLKGMGVFSQSDELRLQARERHMAGETSEAIMLMSQAIQMAPANTRVAMDMVQIFIDIGELEQAKGLFNRLPDRDKESDIGKSLIGQLTFADLSANTPGIDALRQRLERNPQDNEARFELAVCLVAARDYDGAVDQLLAVLQSEPEYKNGAAREMVVTIINMLAPNDPELANQYRTRLSNQLSN